MTAKWESYRLTAHECCMHQYLTSGWCSEVDSPWSGGGICRRCLLSATPKSEFSDVMLLLVVGVPINKAGLPVQLVPPPRFAVPAHDPDSTPGPARLPLVVSTGCGMGRPVARAADACCWALSCIFSSWVGGDVASSTTLQSTSRQTRCPL
jgi:hypothetical protein